MRRKHQHPSGWETGFFRVAATPGNGLLQVHRHKTTGEFKPLPYDYSEKEPESDWEPIYVFRG